MGQLKQILREQILAEMTYDRQMADEEIADLIDRKMDACMENDPEIFPATLGERLKLHKELFDSFRRLDIYTFSTSARRKSTCSITWEKGASSSALWRSVS